MTDKVQLIKEEIEKMYKEAKLVDCFTSSVVETTLERLRDFINSLPEEPASEDLEEEMIRWHKEHFGNKRDWEKTSGEYLTRKSQLDIARHFAEWQKQQMKEALQTEYEKGRFDMREEIMKDAADSKITTDGNSIFPIIKYQLPLTYDCKVGDKVKLIIIKTE